MKTYNIILFDNKGKKLTDSFTVDYDGVVGTRFKNHYRQYAKLFINSGADAITVSVVI